MENAAKALLIAGGILIAIIILSMFVMMYNKMINIQNAQEEKTRLEQIAAFNAEYEAYNKKMMYGADVVTLKNKVEEHNRNNFNDSITIEYPADFQNFDSLTEEEKKDLLQLRFKCTKMEYNNSGRVSEITIEPV